jgi:hypothetical protein
MKELASKFGNALFWVVCISVIAWTLILSDSKKESINHQVTKAHQGITSPRIADFTKKELKEIELVSWATDGESKVIFLKLHNGSDQKISSVDFHVSTKDELSRTFRLYPLESVYIQPKSNGVVLAEYKFALFEGQNDEDSKYSGRIIGASYDKEALSIYIDKKEEHRKRVLELLKTRKLIQ